MDEKEVFYPGRGSINMAGPKISLDADECRTLLGWIEKVCNGYQGSDDTPEEEAVMSKLRGAAKSYTPPGNTVACICDLCGRALYPIDGWGNVINYRGTCLPYGCCHEDAEGRSSLRGPGRRSGNTT
jgi:hypothetical protein